MAAIRDSVEIRRSPEDVFALASDPSRRGEWQDSVRDPEVTTSGPVGQGTRVREIRAVTGGDRKIEWEYTRFEAPSGWSFKGVSGPVRPVGTMSFSPAGADATRVDMEIDFEGHGIGLLLRLLARRDARRQVPRDLAMLKQRLESQSA